MKFLGCQKKSGPCDLCGAEWDYLHSMEGGVHLCPDCAQKKITPRCDRGMPAIAEAWSRGEGGKWVSRWHIEEAYR